MDINPDKMTKEEKLRAMELLWNSICRDLPESLSPEWHGQLLREREQRIKEGKDGFIDWEDAKKDILASIQ